MLTNRNKIFAHTRCLSHEEAVKVYYAALRQATNRIVIDLSAVDDATTSAFAQLVVLRKALLRLGRDLCLTNLRDRAAGVFEVNRLAGVLPLA